MKRPTINDYPQTDSRTYYNLDGTVNWKKYAEALEEYADSLSPAAEEESLTVEPKDNDWRLVGHSSQIADTGDYDGHYEITNGKISLLTKDDDEEALQPVVDAFNNSGCRFYQDDWFEFENKVLKYEIKSLQSIAAVEPMTAEEAQRCPVCGGNGLVPNGFYNTVTGIGSTTSITPEKCLSCNGTGIVFPYASKPTVAEREVSDIRKQFLDEFGHEPTSNSNRRWEGVQWYMELTKERNK